MPSKLEHHAEQLGALGHPVRLAILRFAVQAGVEGATAGAIQTHVDLPASTLSHHLKGSSTRASCGHAAKARSTTTRRTTRRCAS